jgi:hypothetical protein
VRNAVNLESVSVGPDFSWSGRYNYRNTCCLKFGPTLCIYLHSPAMFRHVSMAATTIIREDNATDQKNADIWSCLACTANVTAFCFPLQHRPCLCHTSHVLTGTAPHTARSEPNTIPGVAQNNWFPSTWHDVCTGTLHKNGDTYKYHACYKNKKWAAFTYYSPAITKVTNLYQESRFPNIPEHISQINNQQQHQGKYKNSGFYTLVWHTWNSWFVGQTADV